MKYTKYILLIATFLLIAATAVLSTRSIDVNTDEFYTTDYATASAEINKGFTNWENVTSTKYYSEVKTFVYLIKLDIVLDINNKVARSDGEIYNPEKPGEVTTISEMIEGDILTSVTSAGHSQLKVNFENPLPKIQKAVSSILAREGYIIDVETNGQQYIYKFKVDPNYETNTELQDFEVKFETNDKGQITYLEYPEDSTPDQGIQKLSFDSYNQNYNIPSLALPEGAKDLRKAKD